MKMEYAIIPVPKPRQTRKDVWAKRPCVMRYRFFADQCRALGMQLPESGAHIVFVLPMPKSWSKSKKLKMDGWAHQQTPDVDNLLKSLSDALYEDDACIYDVRISKFWGASGKIIIYHKAVEEIENGRISND